MKNISCFLCFQSIEDFIPGSPQKFGSKNYKQKLFECCSRLLGVKIESDSKLSYSTTSCSPFCSVCFKSSEKLLKIENNEKNIMIKDNLKSYIETLTNEILRFRLAVLSKKIELESDSDDEFADYGTKQSQDNPPEPFMSTLPMSAVPSSSLSVSVNTFFTTELKEETLKEEVIDIFDEYFVVNDGPIDCGDYGRNINLPFQFVDPFAESRARTYNNFHLTTDVQNTPPELRVVLERLQFDSNGKVIIPICTNKILPKRKTAIAAQSSSIKEVKEGIKEEYHLWENDELPTSRISDDEHEFIGGDLNLESNESEGGEEFMKISGSSRKREQKWGDGSFPKMKRPCRRRKAHLKTKQRKKIVTNRKTECMDLLKQGKVLKCLVCSSTHNLNQDLDFHSSESGHINERQFKCSQCFKAYYQQEDLKRHQNLCVYTNRKCKMCKKILFCRNISSYRRHVDSHQENKLQNSQNMKKRRKNKLVYATEYKCAVCSLMFNRARPFHEHSTKEGHANFPSLQCDKCPKKYFILKDLNIHQKNVHEYYLEICPICKQEFTHRITYYYHKMAHKTLPEDREASNDGRPNSRKFFDCSHCGKSINGAIHYKEHFQSHFGKKEQKCDECGAEFFTEGMLLRHKGGHSKQLPFQCTICLLFSKTQRGFNRHIESHDLEKKRIKCDACDQTFLELRHFIAHKITNHEMKSPFDCKHCQKIFTYREHLRAHLRQEHDEKIDPKEPKSCEFCDKILKSPKSLVLHTLLHTNASKDIIRQMKPESKQKGRYQCEECGKIFCYKDGLADHWKKMHAPDAQSNRRTCNICGKVLVNDRYYKKHLAVHEKRFVCEICGRGFSERLSLLGHIKRIHEQNKTPRRSYTRTVNPKLRPNQTNYAAPPNPPNPQ